MQLSSHAQCALFEQQIVTGPRGGEESIIVRYHGTNQQQDPEAREEDDSLLVPIEPDTSSLETNNVNLYGSKATSAYRMGDPYDTWFSNRFSFPTIMVYLGDGRRPVLGKTLPPPGAQEQQVQQQGWISSLVSYMTSSRPSSTSSGAPWITFADMAPLLVTSESSIKDVNKRFLQNGETVDMYKFRPNIVVDGEGESAWAEDFWAELTVTDTTNPAEGAHQKKNTLQLTGNCVRCSSLNVDYETGRKAGGELGNVLKRLMKERRVDLGSKWSPVFGRYAFLQRADDEEFIVSVGDGVAVTRRNEERTVWDWPPL